MVLFGSYIEAKRKAFWKYVESWQSTMYSIVVLAATVVVIFWASVFLYTSFYFTFMPQESITWPIHFQYTSCVEELGLCSNPTAVVGVTDPARGSLLMRGQRYRVVVDLDMPESPTNQRIGNGDRPRPPGMFLLIMEMRNQDGKILRQSSRSAMLRYKSPLLHTISTFVFAPFLLYGLQEEKQMVTVELFSQYEEDPLVPLWEVSVEVGSRHVEIYGARMRIHATFTGLRYVMYHYPLSAATVGVGICMVFLAAIVILSWYQFSGPSTMVQSQPQNFPNSRAPIALDNQKLTSDLSHKKRADSPDNRPDSVATTVFSTSTLNGEGDDFERCDDEQGSSKRGPVARDRSEGDEFEVLSSSNSQGEEQNQRPHGEEDEHEEGGSIVRHRVQSIIE